MPFGKIKQHLGRNGRGVLFFDSQSFAWAVLLSLLLLLIYSLYSLGFPSGLSFDDRWNLSPIEKVHDVKSALEFTLSGLAGPLGRPISLATFLLHAHSWASSPQDLLYTNTLIHLLNVVLVIWFAYRLAPYIPGLARRPEYMALFAGALFGLAPLLLSTSLMAIQRMTLLSATFSLVGVIAHVYLREKYWNRPLRSTIWITVSVGLMTSLATLAKESGALLPSLVLCLELILLAPVLDAGLEPRAKKILLGWRALVLGVPSLLIAAYLLYITIIGWCADLPRPFTRPERLITEPRIIFDYLRLLVLPIRSKLGPYHDDYLVSQGLLSPLSTLMSLVGVVVLFGIAVAIRKGDSRLISFAILWFLIAHLLESTAIPLELYFEHRNYIPAIGLFVGIAALLWHRSLALSRRLVALGAMILYNVFILRESAIIWGNPLLSAALWHQEHPSSLRANQNYSRRLLEAGQVQQFLHVFEQPDPRLESDSGFRTNRLLAFCGFKPADEMQTIADDTLISLRSGPLFIAVTQALETVLEEVTQGRCEGVSEEDVLQLLDAVIQNTHHATGGPVKSMAHELISRVYVERGELSEAVLNLESAFEFRPSLNIGIKMAAVLASAQLFDDAQRKVDQLRGLVPIRPGLRQRWLRTIGEMQDIIDNERAIGIRSSSPNKSDS